jgi:hypothetical protein
MLSVSEELTSYTLSALLSKNSKRESKEENVSELKNNLLLDVSVNFCF